MAKFFMLKALVVVCCVYGYDAAPGQNSNPNANPNASNECRGKPREGQDCVIDGQPGTCQLDPDFQSEAYGQMICQPDEADPEVPEVCADPPTLPHGSITSQQNLTTYHTATYECNNGFHFTFNSQEITIYCFVSSSLWSAFGQTCAADK